MDPSIPGIDCIERAPLVDGFTMDVNRNGLMETYIARDDGRGHTGLIIGDGVADVETPTTETVGVIQYNAVDAYGNITAYEPEDLGTGYLSDTIGPVLHTDPGNDPTVGTVASKSSALAGDVSFQKAATGAEWEEAKSSAKEIENKVTGGANDNSDTYEGESWSERHMAVNRMKNNMWQAACWAYMYFYFNTWGESSYYYMIHGFVTGGYYAALANLQKAEADLAKNEAIVAAAEPAHTVTSLHSVTVRFITNFDWLTLGVAVIDINTYNMLVEAGAIWPHEVVKYTYRTSVDFSNASKEVKQALAQIRSLNARISSLNDDIATFEANAAYWYTISEQAIALYNYAVALDQALRQEHKEAWEGIAFDLSTAWIPIPFIPGIGKLFSSIGKGFSRVAGKVWGSMKRGFSKALAIFARKSFQSIDDILANPSVLKGMHPDDVMAIIGAELPENWVVTTLGKGSAKGKGFRLQEIDAAGNTTGRYIRWHPEGGSRHTKNAYWRASDGKTKSGVIE